METDEMWGFERILIFEPHPDDAVFNIGAVIFDWAMSGKELLICTVTRGNNSTMDPAVSPEELESRLAWEHKKAMAVLGVHQNNLVQWDYDDLGLDPASHRLKLLEDMVLLIRRFKPDTIVSMDPQWISTDENPDHKLVATTAHEASALAAYPNVFRHQLDLPDAGQQFVRCLLFYASRAANMFMDISGEPIEKKIQAGFCYDSQLDMMMTEIKMRLAGAEQICELTHIPKQELWPATCFGMAEDAAFNHACIFPDKPRLELAEEFRLQFLGVVDKLIRKPDENIYEDFWDDMEDDLDPDDGFN